MVYCIDTEKMYKKGFNQNLLGLFRCLKNIKNINQTEIILLNITEYSENYFNTIVCKLCVSTQLYIKKRS